MSDESTTNDSDPTTGTGSSGNDEVDASASGQQDPEHASTPTPSNRTERTDQSDEPLDDEIASGIEELGKYVEQASAKARWAPADYAATGNFGGAAEKLSSSFIAPLVAAARGYLTHDASMRDEAKLLYGITGRSHQNTRLVSAIVRKDVLYMPWYAYDRVMGGQAPLETAAVQFRPSALPPVEPGEKKPAKYEFRLKSDVPLDAHPATPHDWFTDAPVVLVAEGLLKGDAALTGQLLEYGVTHEELSYPEKLDDPRARLRELMERVPAEKRVLVLIIAGAFNWPNHAGWATLDLRDREAWIGLDGDIETNPHVHKQGRQLWQLLGDHKHAKTVRLLVPTLDGGTGDDKAGIDDYLAEYGSWERLLSTSLRETLPARPEGDGAYEGASRVDQGGTSVSVYKITERNDKSVPMAGQWTQIVDIGGRVKSLLADRAPTDLEMKTGRIGAGTNDADFDWEVVVEVCFENPDGTTASHEIIGPARILNYLPDQWEGKGAQIPGPVLVHPSWPPRSKNGEAWVRAVKMNRSDETVSQVRWSAMGWVPAPNGNPVFLVGEQVIGGEDLSDSDDVLPGVDNALLDAADKFGVGDLDPRPFTDPDYQAGLKKDIETVMTVYVRNNVWTDRCNAAVVLAAAMRPCLPIRPQTIPYFTGAKGTGKTFSAEAILYFWQRHISGFGAVPGSANDTAASMELSVSRSLLWIVDDLAPATSRRKSEEERDKIGTLIRNQFNGTARGRANANMESRKKNKPRAVLVITAENEPLVSSERDRVILCDMGYGSLNPSRDPTDELRALSTISGTPNAGAPARVTQGLVKYLRWLSSPGQGSWQETYEEIVDGLNTDKQYTQDRMPDTTPRQATIAADLTMSLAWLGELAAEVGCEDWVLDLLSPGELQADIVGLVADNAASNRETSPGAALIASLLRTLRRGRAYITSAEDPFAPPSTEPVVLQSLGWVPGREKGAWEPAPSAKGNMIGYLVHPEKLNREPVILFDQKVAFQVARANSDGLIPEGQGPRTSWAAVTGERLGVDSMMRKKKDKTGKDHVIQSARHHVYPDGDNAGGGRFISGYPVLLEQLLRGGIRADEDRDRSPEHDDDDPEERGIKKPRGR